MYRRNLFLFAAFTAFCTFLLLIAGGMVTSTGSGLAVPDWPLSYGKLMPPMVGGIFYEHGHRMIASFVGFLTVILTIWILRVEERRWVRGLTVFALAAVVLQGLLGGLTVKMMLPVGVSATHATLAQTFFCTVSALALFLSKWWSAPPSFEDMKNRGSWSPTIFVSTVAVIFVQLILGAIMRHTHAGLAVPDFPLSYGQIIPSLSEQSVGEYNQELIRLNVRLYADGPVTTEQILVHILHRFWALVVLTASCYAAVRLWTLGATLGRLRVHAIILALGVVIQISLGALTVLSRKPDVLATAHQSLGALLLMISMLCLLEVLQFRKREHVMGVSLKTISYSASVHRI